ncbi:MAG: hypothetical protein ACLR0W_07105 [Lachnospira sp.]
MKHEKIIIKPQKGPQENFLATSADICIYGGAAGGGENLRTAVGAASVHEQSGLQRNYLPT